jgi:hypothetical protein
MSAQCIRAVTNITVEGLASETYGYSAVEEIPHIDGNIPLQQWQTERGVKQPPRNSKVLTNLNQIPSSVKYTSITT